MPCRDLEEDARVIYVEDDKSKKALATVEAMLCAVLTAAKNHKGFIALDISLINRVDEGESGIRSKDLKSWWVKHQEEDNLRRHRETLQKQKLLLKETALKKLTPEERKALGL